MRNFAVVLRKLMKTMKHLERKVSSISGEKLVRTGCPFWVYPINFTILTNSGDLSSIFSEDMQKISWNFNILTSFFRRKCWKVLTNLARSSEVIEAANYYLLTWNESVLLTGKIKFHFETTSHSPLIWQSSEVRTPEVCCKLSVKRLWQ